MAEHPLLVAIRPLTDALGAELVAAAAVGPGDVPLVWQREVVGGVRLPALHGQLERMLAAMARERGVPLRSLGREEKQAVVRDLEGRGAFLLRRAVEEVAEALGVSRFTVYNYLNAGDRST